MLTFLKWLYQVIAFFNLSNLTFYKLEQPLNNMPFRWKATVKGIYLRGISQSNMCAWWYLMLHLFSNSFIHAKIIFKIKRMLCQHQVEQNIVISLRTLWNYLLWFLIPTIFNTKDNAYLKWTASATLQTSIQTFIPLINLTHLIFTPHHVTLSILHHTFISVCVKYYLIINCISFNLGLANLNSENFYFRQRKIVLK